MLFVERAPGKTAAGYWTPVTGRLEPGESAVEAACREVLEETGLVAVAGRELARTDTDAPGGGSAGYDLVWLDASVVGDAKALRLQASEVSRARWVTRAQALALDPLFPTTRRFLPTPPPLPSARPIRPARTSWAAAPSA